MHVEPRYRLDPRVNAKSYFDSQHDNIFNEQKAKLLLQSVKRARTKPETRFPIIHALWMFVLQGKKSHH